MEEDNLLSDLKKLDILIAKRMFKLVKKDKNNRPPSHLQANILGFLLENKDKIICQKDIEKKLKISKATISEVLGKMEKNNLIVRIANSEDGRSKQIILTDESLEKYNEMKENIERIKEELSQGISDDEINNLRKTLNKLIKNMENIEGINHIKEDDHVKIIKKL